MKKINKITLTSTLVAIGVVLDLMIKFIPGLNLEMPQGGLVFGFSMLPIILIGILIDFKYGILGGIVFGLVNVLIDGGLFHIASLFSDYIFAFGLLGFSGLFKNALDNKWKISLVILFSAFLRYLSHSLGGALIFAEFAPEGVNPWFYSFILYNLPYMISSTFITIVFAILLMPFLKNLKTNVS